MHEIKTLNGGLNTDDAPDYLDQSEYTESHNYRSGGTVGQDTGDGTNIEGTVLIDFTLPAGLTTNIGVGVFKEVRKAYGVAYNSSGRRQLLEFDYDTLQLTALFTDLTDTGGVQLMNILPSHYFNDIKLYHEKYLIMTDGISGMIYCINLERLKSGGYQSPIIADDFNLIKAQPLKPIKAEYISDGEKTANLLKGKLFQFRYQNEYFDLLKSTWGTISKRPVPEFETTAEIGDDPRKLNGIQLTVSIGDDRVQKINIASRADLFNWYIIKSVTREYVLTLPASIDIAQETREAYNPSTNEYTFIFYNDGAYEPIPVLDTDESYDAVPTNAGTLEVLNGDILALADLEEGYNRPSGLDVQVGVTTYELKLETSITNPRNFEVFGSNARLGGWQHRSRVELKFYGTPKTGDLFTLGIDQFYGRPSTPQTYEYLASGPDNNNLDSFTTNLMNYLPDNSFVNPEVGYHTKYKAYNPDGSISVIFITPPYFELKNAYILLDQVGDVQGLTKSIVKSNTSYQLALFHYDKYGRYFPILTNDKYVVNTPSFATSEGFVPQINWNILTGTPPDGAVSYQWGISENTKYQSNLYITGIYDSEESEDDFIYLNLFSLDSYYKTSPSGIVSYDFTEGDRVVFINNFNATTQPIKWFNNPTMDFPVAGFEIKVEDDGQVKYLLKIKRSTIIDPADLDAGEILMEIYTPKKNNESLESKIFYEMGEQFDIINGEYSVKSGSIREVDAYLRPRKFRSNVENSNDVFAFPVEDFNFSDDYVSKLWSNGRGRTYNDEVGKVRRKASIRYSEPSSIGSLSNNINRFYGNRLYGDEPAQTTAIYGAITKLIMRDHILIALQELKVGHIPVNNSIITDNAEQEQLAISDTLFNNVRYLNGNIGTGLAKRAITISNVGNVYFVDHNNGYVCRDGYDGLRVITNKMTKYFHERIKSTEPNQMVLIFDDFNNELNFVFIDLQGEIKVITFDISEWEYKDNYTKTTDQVDITPPAHGTAIFQDGNILYTPEETYYGSDAVVINFLDGTTPVSKRACITVVQGISNINPFSFIELFDQPTSTQLVSNSIFVAGNTLPVPISVVNGEYRINDGVWTSANGTVEVGDKVEVRHLSGATGGVSTSTTLTISNQTGVFKDTTIVITDVAPFSFTALTDQELTTLLESNTITVTGNNVTVPISIVGGEYQINGGAWTSTSGTVLPSATVKVRQTSSEENDTLTTATLTVSNQSAEFNVTTKESTSIACGAGSAYAGGESFPTEETVILGSDLGNVTLTFDAYGIPDKFIVIFDGVEVINTGYRGDVANQSALDANLTGRGLPTEPIVGAGSGTASFNKTTATTTAIVRVYAPLSGTSWTYTLSCPA